MSCSQIKEIPYREFSDHIHDEVVSNNVPINGTIELTSHCNLKCVHCYIQDNTTVNELTYKEVCSIIDQIVDAGCLWLLFTGGEPLVRDDFLDIYTYAKKKGLLLTLFTNATLVTKEIAACLKEFPPFSIEVTLYGATKETYEEVTGIPDSFNSCIEGIRLLRDQKLPVKLKTMVISLNKDELKEMQTIARSFGASFKYDTNINPALNKSMAPCNYRLPPEEVVKIEINDEAISTEWRKLSKKYRVPVKKDSIFNCGAGKNLFHVNPIGRLQVCGVVQNPFFDLREVSFTEAYKLFKEILSIKPEKDHDCEACKIAIFCDYCAGWSELENNNMNKKVDYLCEIAYKRAEYFLEKGGAVQ